MGVDTIRQLIGVVEDKDLKEHLKTQFQGYEEFHQAAKELLNEHGYDEKGGCGMQSGCELCGMMRVVIDNGNATDGSLIFKSTVRAREVVQCGNGNSTVNRQQIG